MEYYSQLEYDIYEAKVDKQCINKLKQKFKAGQPEVHGFGNVDFSLYNDKLVDIILKDYYAKFYDDKYFANELQKCITDGIVYLKFTGQYDDMLGLIIDKDGVYEIEYVIIPISNNVPDYIRELFNIKYDNI